MANNIQKMLHNQDWCHCGWSSRSLARFETLGAFDVAVIEVKYTK